jgi:V-type H+-transporting ATPase subunit H
MIKEYDSRAADKSSLIEGHGKAYAKIFLVLLSKVQKVEYIQYVITMIEDLLKEDNERARFFQELSNEQDEGGLDLPFGPFTALLRRKQSDWYINARAANIIAIFFTQMNEVPQDVKEFAFKWFIDQLKKETDRDVLIALTALMTVVRKGEYRVAFYQAGALQALTPLVKYKSQDQNFQLLYQALFCLWMLTFNSEVKEKMTDPELVFNLVEILKQVEVLKVRRMTIATLRNMLDMGNNNEQMISFGIMKTLNHLNNRKWGDEDIPVDLQVMLEVLNKKVTEMSSFDMYKNECLSKKLDWTSPAHKSERFWRENISRFEDDDYLVLRILKEIIGSNDCSSRVIAVACWDLGEFVRFHPRGKVILQHIGAKVPIMSLLAHGNDEVQKEALLALQKLMVTNWEYLRQ